MILVLLLLVAGVCSKKICCVKGPICLSNVDTSFCFEKDSIKDAVNTDCCLSPKAAHCLSYYQIDFGALQTVTCGAAGGSVEVENALDEN